MTDLQRSAVGLIPTDWQCTAVRMAYEICNQKRLPLSQERRREMEGPYPYYGPTGVLDYINEYRFDGNYALIGEDGDHFLKFSKQPMTLMARGKFNVNNHAHVIGPRDGNLVEWFQTYFENRDIFSALTRQGAGRFKLTKAALQDLPMALPSKDEQREIVDAISDVRSLISVLERQIAKKLDIRQGMTQQLLTAQTRLPGFSKPWRHLKIEEVLAPRSERNTQGLQLEVLTCTKHRGFVRSLDYFKNQIFSRDLIGYRVIYHGDIGYPANHVEEGSIGVQEVVEKGLVSPIYVVMRAKEGIDTYFLQRQLKLESYRQEFSRVTNASVNRRGSLRWREFSQITVLVPELIEQHAISTALRNAESDIEVLGRRLEKAKDIKQGMLQELLTGRTRLPVKEAVL